MGHEMVRYGLLARISETLDHYVRGAGGAQVIGGAAS
jgi:hypothetical protein